MSLRYSGHVLLHKLFCTIYPGYDPHGLAPLDCVKNFPHDIPVLLITSKKDTFVSAENVWNVYNALKKAGRPDVYLLQLENSTYPRYLWLHTPFMKNIM